MLWLIPTTILLLIFRYYIVYPGGKKNWEKRQKEMKQHSGDSEFLEDELHD